MKNLLALLLALTMALTLCACGSTPAPAPAGSSGASSSGGSAAASSAASSSGEDALVPTLVQCGDHITNDLFDMSLDSVELADEYTYRTSEYSSTSLYVEEGYKLILLKGHMENKGTSAISSITTSQTLHWTLWLSIVPAVLVPAVAITVLVRRKNT